MAAEDVGALVVRIEANLNDFNKGIEGVSKKVDSFGDKVSKLAGIIAGAFAVKAIAKFGSQLITTASDAAEMQNKFNVVFGNISADAEAWAQDFRNKVGGSRVEIKGMLADTQDLLTGFGATTEQGFMFSTQIQQLGTDLASFQNVQGGAEEAVQKLRKGLLGEAEGLKLLGIIINETTLNQELASRGDKRKITDLTELEKIELRYAVAMKQSKNAIGDAERTSKDYANMLRNLKGRILDAAAGLGDRFLPVAKQVITYLANKMPDIEKAVGDAFTRIQEVMTPIIQVAAPLFISGFQAIGNVIRFVSDHFSVFGPILAGVTAGLIAYRTITLAVTLVTNGLKAAQAALNVMMSLNPYAKIAILIGALVTAGIALYRNWDNIKYYGIQAWGSLKKFVFESLDKMLVGIERFLGWIPSVSQKVVEARAKLASSIASEEILNATRKYERAVEMDAKADQKAAEEAIKKAQSMKDSVPAYNAASVAALGLSDKTAKLAEETTKASNALTWQEFELKKLEQRWQIIQAKYTDSTTETQKLANEQQHLNDKLFLVNEGLSQAQKNLEYVTKNFAANSEEVQNATLAVGDYQVQQAELRKQLNATTDAMKAQLSSWQKLISKGGKESAMSGALLWAAEAAAGGRWEGFGENAKWIPGTGNVRVENGKFLPALAKGTNFVPFDTAAFLHKGEAVIPAKNNPTAGGSMGGLTVVNQGTVVGRNGMQEFAEMVLQVAQRKYGQSVGGSF